MMVEEKVEFNPKEELDSIERDFDSIRNLSIIIEYAKLWGMEMADARSDKKKYQFMESYDSEELLSLLSDWKNQFFKEGTDDLVDFFYRKFNALMEKI